MRDNEFFCFENFKGDFGLLKGGVLGYVKCCLSFVGLDFKFEGSLVFGDFLRSLVS